MGDITVMRLLLVLGACALAAINASQASAQELFGNPFASAKALRAQRGETPKATLRLKYEASAEPKDKQQAAELVIDVAADWALVLHGARRTVYDFRLGRVLELQDDGTFMSRGMTGDVAFRVAERQNRTRLTAALGAGGLADKWDAYPDSLSGGQQQRVAIVRALAMRPDLMLLDEVTSALDPELVAEVLQVIRELASGGMTMLIATHEMSFARDIADRICFLDAGVILEQGPPARILSEPSELRTQQFLQRIIEAGRL